MNLTDLLQGAHARHLRILGHFAPEDSHGLGHEVKTVVLLGPDEPHFWSAFEDSSEYRDGAPDPMDRWSARVIGDWAREIGGEAYFPFGGPPYAPFYQWALTTGAVWPSPIRLLIHAQSGLFVSFRGALGLPYAIPQAPVQDRPCDSCTHQPCRSACPVAAFDGSGYDTIRCHDHLNTMAGADCMTKGCRARRACPISQNFGRVEAQSHFHMRSFHP